jgi:Condensation domain/Thioesterase domain
MVPFSFGQARLIGDRLDDRRASNAYIRAVLPIRCDESTFQQALQDLVDRHEILRTLFSGTPSGWRTRVLDSSRAVPRLERATATEAELAATTSAALAPRFALDVEPPIRAHLLDMESGAQIVLLVVHPVAVDSWSVRPLIGDLFAACEARLRHAAPVWSPLPYSTQACTPLQCTLDDRIHSESLMSRRLSWWSDVLAPPSTPLDLPAALRQLSFWLMAIDRPILPRGVWSEASNQPATVSSRIGSALHEQLIGMAAASRSSLLMVLHAGVAAALTGLGAGTDMLVGTVVSGRGDHAMAPLVGLFENALLLRTDTSGDPSFADLLHRLRDTHVQALACQVPIGLVIERVSQTLPLQVMLALEPGPELSAWWPAATTTVKAGGSFRGTFRLLVRFTERRSADGRPAGLDCDAEFAQELFGPDLAHAMLAQIIGVLAAAASDSRQTIGQLIESSYRHASLESEHTAPEAAVVPPAGGETTPAATRLTRPRDVLQDRLADLWERLLGVRPIGIQDDFFERGGSTQLATLMLTAIESLCRATLPSSAFRDRLTIEQLAEALVMQVPAAPVLEIQPGDPAVKTPLFFLHGDLGGGGFYVRELARGLGVDQPLYVLQQHGLHGEDVPPSIEAMADDQLSRLRACRPHGPYCLGGHCNGATIAFEMAQRLIEADEDVVALLLIEPPLGAYRGTTAPPPLLRLSPEHMRSPRSRGPWLFSQYLSRVRQYQLRPYRGHVAIFWARHGNPARPDPGLVFGSLAEKVDVRVVPGTHISALGRHVASLAAEIKAYLDGCRAAGDAEQGRQATIDERPRSTRQST